MMSHCIFYVVIFAKCLPSSHPPPSIQNMFSCQMPPFPTKFVVTPSFGRFSRIPLGPLMEAIFMHHLVHLNEALIVIERDLFPKTVSLLVILSSTSYMHSLAGRGQRQMHVSTRLLRVMTFTFLQENTSLQMQVSLCGPNYSSLTVMCATTLQNGAAQV